MLPRKYQSIISRCGTAIGKIPEFLQRLSPGVSATTALSVPFPPSTLITGSIPMESLMTSVLAVVGVAAGITLGIVYRCMSESQEVLRKEVEAAKAELRAVLTMTDDAVLILDEHTIIRGANPAAEELFGLDVEELLNSELQNLVSYPLNLVELTRSGPASFKTTALQRGGDTKVNIVLSEVHLSKGKSFLALIRDQNAEANEPLPQSNHPDLSGPVGKFSHDLNNALTGIIGNLSLIMMTSQPDAVTGERITGAKRSAIRAQELNRKLLGLAKGEEIEAEVDSAHSNQSSSPTIVPLPSMMSSAAVPQHHSAPVRCTESAIKGSPRVLVLDDEETICELISTTLSSLGYSVTETHDAEQAIRACEEAAAAGNPFDLVISDLSLPGGLTGQEAVNRMRAIDPNLKAIVSSGYDSDPVMIRFREHGFCAAISKPYDISKLSRVVISALASDEEQRKTA